MAQCSRRLAFRIAAVTCAAAVVAEIYAVLVPSEQMQPHEATRAPSSRSDAGAAAYCEGVMNRTGGVLGFPAETFYKAVQRRMTVGELARSGDCEWTLDLRQLVLPGIEVQSTGGAVPAGEVGTVQSVGVDPDVVPDAAVPVRFRRVGLRTVHRNTLRILLHSLDDAYGPDECPVQLHRSEAGAGGTFELPPLTAQRAADLDAVSARTWTSVRYRWCAHPGFFADFCRACGYSCNWLSTWSPERVHRLNVSYPLVRADPPVQPCSVIVDKSAVFPKKDSRKVLPTVRVQHRLRLFDAAPQQLETAARMGWDVDVKGSNQGKLADAGCNGPPTDLLAFFVGIAKLRKVLYINVGHWFQDVFFPLFQLISSYVNLTQPDPPKYHVVVLPGQWEWSWAPMPELAGMAHLLTSLTPSRPPLRQGQCYRRAVFDCPQPNAMGPMRAWQDWLEARHGFMFAPLPSVTPGAGAQHKMLVMIRRWGGDRHLANWRTLVAAAKSRGFDVDVPLSEASSGPETRAASLLRLAEEMQRAHVLVGCHGAEIAGMPFLPRGSVVVEIIPAAMRHIDMWYVRQAEAGGQLLVRWSLAHEHVQWATPVARALLHSDSRNCSRGPVTNVGVGAQRRDMATRMCWQIPPDPSGMINETGTPAHCRRMPVCLRTTSSDITPPAAEWSRLLTLVSRLLAQGSGEPPQSGAARRAGEGPGVHATRAVPFNPQRWLRKSKKMFTGVGFV